MRRLAVIGALLAGALPLGAALARADSFNPVRVRVRVRSHARARKPLKMRVSVVADAGVLDARSGSLRVQVKLAKSLCGATFTSTVGRVILNKRLKPQPHVGKAYSAHVKGKARPRILGTHPLCIFLDDSYEEFYSDTTDYTVTVRR